MARRLILALVLLVLVPACGDNAGGDEVRAVVFNLCGNVCGAGGDDALPFVVDLVEDTGARVVLLQEVCRSQAEHLRDRLEAVWGGAAVHHVTTFAGDLDGANRCADDDYGMAIVAPTIERPRMLPLPNPGLGTTQIDERSLICAAVADDLTACTTHLVRRKNDADAHELQADALVEHAFTLADEGGPVLVAGDLNDDVARFDALGGYRSSGDRDSLDHAFATRTDFSAVTVDERFCDCSDHPAMVVTLTR